MSVRTATQSRTLQHGAAGVQALAEALARASTREEVAEAVFAHLLPAVGAAAGTLVLRAEQTDALELVGATGYQQTTLDAFRRIPLEAATPAAEVVRTRQPLWIGNASATENFPYLAERATGHQALAVLPLLLEEQATGALVLAFSEEREFEPAERLLLLSVAAQCAVSLQRADSLARERASRERLEVALGAARMGTWDWDLRTNRVEWSPELEKIHGFEPGALGSTLDRYFAHLHPEDRERVRAEIGVSLQTGELRLEYRGISPDGELRWFEARGQLTRDASGQPVALRGVCMDVTDRNQAEQALRESEQRFRTLADNIAPFAWMADSAGWIFWYSRRWYEYTGTTFEEMQGWGWTKVHHPNHVDRVVERIKRSWETGEPWEDTFPLRRRDGQYRWFLSRALPIRDERGRIVRWLGTNTDITERRWTEALLAGQRNALELITQGVPANAVLEQLCRTVEELADDGLVASILLLDEEGIHLHHAAAPGLPDAYNQAIDGVAIGPNVGSCGTAAFLGEQVVVSDIATDRRWADFRELALSHGLRACWSTPIRGLNDRILGTFALYYHQPRMPTAEHLRLTTLVGGTAATVIERQQMEAARAQLYESEKAALAAAEAAIQARDDFVAVVSHDLRNPLAAVHGHLQLLRRRAARGEVLSAEHLVERIDVVQSSIAALSAQIDELHDATQLHAGRRLDLHRTPTDLVALARDGVIRHQHASESHVLRFECALAELVGTWDSARLERVLANLLANALKYSPSGGEIVVEVGCEMDCAVLSVADQGIGIPAADLPYIFERFRRASNVAGRIVGSGLGLAGARDIVEQHGGAIGVQSDEGHGSTFMVRLPLRPDSVC